MRLLTFKIGPVLLAIKVDSVVSVGVDKRQEDPNKTGGLKVDLSKVLGLGNCASPNPAVIRCSHNNRIFELKADQILGLEDIAPARHLAWPAVLAFMGNYSGVAVVEGKSFLNINLDAVLSGLKK